MAGRKRRNHPPTFKGQVAVAALKGDKTLAESAQHPDVHPNQIAGRRRAGRPMKKTGIEALYRKPGLGRRHAAHPICPHLLRNLETERPNPVRARTRVSSTPAGRTVDNPTPQGYTYCRENSVQMNGAGSVHRPDPAWLFGRTEAAEHETLMRLFARFDTPANGRVRARGLPPVFRQDRRARASGAGRGSHGRRPQRGTRGRGARPRPRPGNARSADNILQFPEPAPHHPGGKAAGPFCVPEPGIRFPPRAARFCPSAVRGTRTPARTARCFPCPAENAPGSPDPGQTLRLRLSVIGCNMANGQSGFKPKTMVARAGERTFEVPRVRGGGFYPGASEKGSRTGRAPNIVSAEMYVRGVPAREVVTVLQALPGAGVSISPARLPGVSDRPTKRLVPSPTAWSGAVSGASGRPPQARMAGSARHAARPCPACHGSAASSICGRTRGRMSRASTSANPWRGASCARRPRSGALRRQNLLGGPGEISPGASPLSACPCHNPSARAPPAAPNALTAKSNAVPAPLPSSQTPLPARALSPRRPPNAMRGG